MQFMFSIIIIIILFFYKENQFNSHTFLLTDHQTRLTRSGSEMNIKHNPSILQHKKTSLVGGLGNQNIGIIMIS